MADVVCQAQVPLTGVSTVAYNSNNTRIAASDGQRIVVRGSLRPEDNNDHRMKASSSADATDGLDTEWDVSSMVVESTAGTVTAMEWLGVEHGNVLVCGTDTGVVLVYAEDPEDRRDGCVAPWYRKKAVLRYSTSSVTCLKAGAPALSVGGGPVFAVGYADGSIRMFEYSGGGAVGIGWSGRTPVHSNGAKEGNNEADWSVHSVISCPVQSCRGCMCMDIKYGREDVIVLIAGYTGCQIPQMYAYHAMSFMWRHVNIDMGEYQQEIEDVCNGEEKGVDAVSWAPLMGRQEDLIAVATGSDVTLLSVSGPLDTMMTVERVAVLKHETDVWQLGWNVTGTWLAASTDSNMVCLWRPDLGGEWKLLHTIEGVTS